MIHKEVPSCGFSIIKGKSPSTSPGDMCKQTKSRSACAVPSHSHDSVHAEGRGDGLSESNRPAELGIKLARLPDQQELSRLAMEFNEQHFDDLAKRGEKCRREPVPKHELCATDLKLEGCAVWSAPWLILSHEQRPREYVVQRLVSST